MEVCIYSSPHCPMFNHCKASLPKAFDYRDKRQCLPSSACIPHTRWRKQPLNHSSAFSGDQTGRGGQPPCSPPLHRPPTHQPVNPGQDFNSALLLGETVTGPAQWNGTREEMFSWQTKPCAQFGPGIGVIHGPQRSWTSSQTQTQGATHVRRHPPLPPPRLSDGKSVPHKLKMPRVPETQKSSGRWHQLIYRQGLKDWKIKGETQES